MLTAQIGGDPGPSGPKAPTLSETAKRKRRPSTIIELGTIRMVGLLRIFRSYWSRTTPRPCGARPASTSWTGEGPSEGATMAPEICRESSGGGAALDPKNRTAMPPPLPRSPDTRCSPDPPIQPDPASPRYPTQGGIRPLARATGREGCDDGCMHADIVIRGGTVVDGTGAPGRAADVAITGGRISDIGPGLQGRRVLDATGQIVSPGFVDIHTHYDAQVFWDPNLTPSSFHGVTSVIAGNCGFSIAPIRAEGVPLLARTLQHVEDMSFDTLAAGVPWGEFETFPQYLDAVEGRGTALNFGCYVGHTAVRLYVMGEAAYERPATDDEIALMQAVVADAMAGGAAGFASSASPTHNGDKGRPVPSRVADLAELRALLEPVKQSGRGVVALLPGGVFPNEEVFRLQREVGRPFTWTALLTVKGYPYHEKVVAEHDAAWADGIEVWPQVSCRPLVFQMNLSEPFTLNMRPTFAALMGKSKSDRVAAYRDPPGGRRPGRT